MSDPTQRITADKCHIQEQMKFEMNRTQRPNDIRNQSFNFRNLFAKQSVLAKAAVCATPRRGWRRHHGNVARASWRLVRNRTRLGRGPRARRDATSIPRPGPSPSRAQHRLCRPRSVGHTALSLRILSSLLCHAGSLYQSRGAQNG